MITDFADFCLWMYVLVDDIWLEIAPLFQRPGPAPQCSDSELLTMALIGECRGWDQETVMLSHWQEHRDLFPHIPSQSRFNRRRRALQDAFNLVRRKVLRLLDLARDGQCALDCLPVPVVQFHLVPSSSGDWAAHGATFGKVPSKKQTIFGFKLYLLTTLSGVIVDLSLVPANVSELYAGLDLLQDHTDLLVFGDKAFVSAPMVADLRENNRVQVVTIPRRNQKRQMSRPIQRLINSVRQIIETVNGQLTEQFHIETNHAHTFWGLCTRLHTKLAAHTLCIYINRLLGRPNFLQIKRLAFPI